MLRSCIPAALALALVSCGQESSSNPSAAPAADPVQIPKIADAANPDWPKQAHQVLILNPVDNAPGARADLAVAWTTSAFLLQAHTDDTTPVETNDELWNGDCVGLVLTSTFGSNDDKLEIVAAPGRTPDHPAPRWHAYDKRTGAPALVPPEVRVTRDKGGYTLTISVSWANFAHRPQAGEVIGVQVYLNDAQGANPPSHRTWYPNIQTGDPLQMERVQLADQAGPPEIATARVHPKAFNDFAVAVLATPDAAGKEVAIWSGEKQVASAKLAPGGLDGDSTADIPLPLDLAAQKDAPLLVTIDSQPVPTALKVPDLAALRLDLIRNQPLMASPSVFDGTVFPKIDFLNKDLIEAAIGSYTLTPRFFDAHWNPVTAPSAPGRYGALVDFRSEDGLTCTRQVTLFKTAHPYNPAKDPYSATMKFPAAFGFPATMLANEQWNISDWTGGEMEYLATHDDWLASYLAGLKDLADDPARFHGFEVWKIDQEWWAELLKRQGADQEYPHLTYLPNGYDKSQKAWPLVLFLHGSGSRGNDLSMVKDDGPLHYIHEGHPLPFIVVTPQCPPHEGWITARLAHLIDEVSAANRVDPKRIYVTGLSMGGRGTWDLAATYPDRFAAIAPVAGAENPAIAERLKKMPTWVFHGSEDTVVPTRYSLDIVDAMQGFGAPVKLTLYPGLGHGGWDMTYDNPALYAWFLQQSK